MTTEERKRKMLHNMMTNNYLEEEEEMWKKKTNNNNRDAFSWNGNILNNDFSDKPQEWQTSINEQAAQRGWITPSLDLFNTYPGSS